MGLLRTASLEWLRLILGLNWVLRLGMWVHGLGLQIELLLAGFVGCFLVG